MDFGDILKEWDARHIATRCKARTASTQSSGDGTYRKESNAASFLQSPSHSKPDSHNSRSEPLLAQPKQSSHKISSKSTISKSKMSNASSSNIHAMQEEWLHQHITFDKDAAADKEAEKEAQRSMRYVRNMPPDACLDLHGYTQSEAWRRLSDFIDECMRRGARKALIIHGKGIHTVDRESVLSGVVRDFIERDGRCGASGHPDRKLGGRGATWVMLKR